MSYYSEHRAEISKKRRYHYRRNWQGILRQRKAKYAALSHKEKHRIAKRQQQEALQRLYHLSGAAHKKMRRAQRNRCACCQKPFGTSAERRPCVDHDRRCCPQAQSCGFCVRALLCRWCNRLIGIIEKHPELTSYIRRKNHGVTK